MFIYFKDDEISTFEATKTHVNKYHLLFVRHLYIFHSRDFPIWFTENLFTKSLQIRPLIIIKTELDSQPHSECPV